MLTPDAQSKFRPRRRHKKSRNGCMECKRRRIKCDEIKPSCSRCILTRQDCIYQPTSPTTQAQSAANAPEQSVEPSLFLPPPSPRSAVSPSPSPSYEMPRLSPVPFVGPVQHFDYDTTDAGLYHHYLLHTSRTLTDNQQDFHALQICMPTLALRSKTVYHSILAVSAACMCYDMIYKDPPPDISTVSNILMTGYHHYNLASERLRELISRPSAANAEPLLAAPPLLVPFVTSSQQINHWISSRSEGQHPSQKLLATTPRDVIILSRGISATIRALAAHPSSSSSSSPSLPTSPQSLLTEELDSMAIDDYNPLLTAPIPPPGTLPPSHNHPLYHIIKTTSEAAFAKLQDRIDSAFIFSSSPITTTNSRTQQIDPSIALSACASAFEFISTLRSAVFPPSHLAATGAGNSIPLPPCMTTIPSLPSSVPSWLASFTCRPSTPSPTTHMTRPFLSLFVHAPQAYLDLTLPLLDKRLEGPRQNTTPGGVHDELSVPEALALDIYAHWSVLMFLVSEESWFIGKLPEITLSGMLNRFGDDFVGRIWADTNTTTASSSITSGGEGGEGTARGEWWPRSMLRIERELGRYQYR